MGPPLYTVLIISIIMPATLQSKEVQNAQLITKGVNEFAVNFYLALPKAPTTNIICSPISAQIPLTLAYHGANGETAQEMATVLRVPDSKEQGLDGMKSLLNGLQNPTLKIATKMFIDKHFAVKPQFKTVANTYFLSGMEEKDFQENSNQARVQINSWVENQTNNKIKDLLPQDAVTPNTRVILVNAIHFKGKWKYPFKPENTVKAPFYITPSQTVQVDMMKLYDKRFKYYESEVLGAKILEMPYSEEELSMVIICPNDIDGLRNVEDKLAHLPEELAKTHEVPVNVHLPKFKIESEWQLKETLVQMGMKLAFSGGADFTGISDAPLKIDAVIQKAFIEVNEEGTEAAAATGVIFVGYSLHASQPRNITLDRPFLYLISSSRPRGYHLFFGSVKNPILN